ELSGSSIFTEIKLEYNSTYNLSKIRTGDLNNDGLKEILLVEQESNSTIKILQKSGNSYEIKQNLSLPQNLTDFQIGNIDNDGYLDIITNRYDGSGVLELYLQNNKTNYYYSNPNGSKSTGVYNAKVLALGNMFQLDQSDFIYSWHYLFSQFWNTSTEMVEQTDAMVLVIGPSIVLHPTLMIVDDLDNINNDDVILYGHDDSNNTYFKPVTKSQGTNSFNDSFAYTNLTAAPNYSDISLLDMNADNQVDILSVNKTGVFIYYQNSNLIYPTLYNDSILYDNLFKISTGSFNQNDMKDILVSDGQNLIIFNDSLIHDTPRVIFTGLEKIIDISVDDLNNDGIDEIIMIARNGSEFQLVILHHLLKQDRIPEKETNRFVLEIVVSGSLAVVTAAASFLSPAAIPSRFEFSRLASKRAAGGGGSDPLELADTTQDKNLDLGYKKPGKWYKKKRFAMYLTALGIGIGLSMLFLFLIYPVVLSSSWIVLFGGIIGPIGFFYGIYNFIFTGFYEHRGNLWKAYYKDKKKFFWDVFSWAKPILSFYCIYTTFNMFWILTFNNLNSVVGLFTLLISSFIGLLLFSVYILKVNKPPNSKSKKESSKKAKSENDKRTLD
ncbi:MAG: hypothetical protein GF329_19285, partial [Candidatus Lokiarchaeota archaeon]|nr:hypothetical protein [Candidatus Lokiarchaeota archaeon]